MNGDGRKMGQMMEETWVNFGLFLMLIKFTVTFSYSLERRCSPAANIRGGLFSIRCKDRSLVSKVI